MALEVDDSRVTTAENSNRTLYVVEEMMCDDDQRIIHENESTEVVAFENRKSINHLAAPLRVAITVLGRNLMPAVLKVYYVYLRQQQFVVDGVRHYVLPTVVAFVVNNLSKSLASVQKRLTTSETTQAIIKESSEEDENFDNSIPEKSVDCQVLSSPESGEILADVIFIHGLHGGVEKTWKQGQWRHDGHKLKHQTPVRSQSSGDVLHVPPRKNSVKRAMSEIYWRIPYPYKIARKDENECCASGSESSDFESDVEESEDEEGYSKCWPQDWLPKDCPGVRVIALNYTTDILWCPVWKKKRHRTDMVERSDEMIQELIALGVGNKPIIWVGHSKGGLFIKQIILNAWERHFHRLEIRKVIDQSKAIMFYSVPHKGSSLADVTIPLLRRSVEVVEIKRNCDFVLNQHKRFLDICEQGHFSAEIFSFIETSFTLMSFIFLKIVALESADPDIGIKCTVPLDHREICKPAGRDCFLYRELVKLIKKHIQSNNNENVTCGK